ncbi:MAG: hypothetical protein N2V78_09085 [Methanophagales archaeon]|nr:hypothetical protein [Methanophagales archaeon]
MKGKLESIKQLEVVEEFGYAVLRIKGIESIEIDESKHKMRVHIDPEKGAVTYTARRSIKRNAPKGKLFKGKLVEGSYAGIKIHSAFDVAIIEPSIQIFDMKRIEKVKKIITEQRISPDAIIEVHVKEKK